MLETAVAGLAFHNDALPIRGVIPHNLLMPINQLEGVAQDIPRTFTLMPTATRADYEQHPRAAGRRRAAGRSDDRADGAGAAAGMTPPRITHARRAGSGAGADRRRSAEEPDARGIHGVAGVDRRKPSVPALTARADGCVSRSGRPGVHEAPRVPDVAGICRHAATASPPARCPTAPRCTPTT